MEYVGSFVVGGIICVIAQILMDATKLTPAHVLVSYVTGGVILTVAGVYEYLVEIGGCGATVPLTGFGYSLGKGVMKAVETKGLLGVFVGGVQAGAGGVAAAVVFGYIMAVVFSPRTKK